MPTSNQLCYSGKRFSSKPNRKRTPALRNSPHLKGVCYRLYTQTPKKPNSALRKLARIRLSNGLKIIGAIPGEGHNLQEHSNVLIRGGRVKDLPGVKYKIVRGTEDLQGLPSRRNARSKYGTKRSKN